MKSTSILLLVSTFAGQTLSMGSQIKPFKVDLSSRVPAMLDLICTTRLPAAEVPAANNSPNGTKNSGISLATLQQLRKRWLTDFDWNKEQNDMNRYDFPSQLHLVLGLQLS